MNEIDEKKVQEEFEKLLEETLIIYEAIKNVNYPALEIFVEDRVWDSTLKYERMMITTKEKFFEALNNRISVEEYTKGMTEAIEQINSEYTKGIEKMWGNIDHSYMDKTIKELQKMVIQKDFNDAEMYGDKKITKRSIKLENSWQDYKLIDKELYRLNPERDFRTMERRYMNRHIKLYQNVLNRYEGSQDYQRDLANYVKEYDKLDKTIPYYDHKTGNIRCYQTVSTYNNMLYNVNLLRSSWNRSIYDSKLLDNHLWYLPAHPYACPHCMDFQGYVYCDRTPTPRETQILLRHGKPGFPYKENAIENGVGHPNCKHNWTLYWIEDQIQEDKYDNADWEEKYKTQQKIQSLDLKKSRLLSDRRIYKELEQWDLVDKTTAKIKRIREKKKELETQV